MDDLQQLLTFALGAIAIGTAAGLGLLRGRVTALREQLKDSDDEMARKDRRLTEAEGKVEKLETELAALGRVVTGEAHLTALETKLDEHHDQAEKHWKRDEQLLEEIRDRLPRSA